MKKTYRSRVFWLLILAVLAAFSVSGAAAESEKSAELGGADIYTQSEDAVFYVRGLTSIGLLKSAGTCFAVSADGYCITAAHVINGSASVNVVLPDGTELVGVKTVYHNTDTDISVIKLPEREQGYAFLTPAPSAPDSGSTVYAIGYPLKTAKIVTDGIVSSPSTKINGNPRLLITSPFASGMSGGPLLDTSGEVVGVISGTLRTMNGVSISPEREQIKIVFETIATLKEGITK